MNLLQNLGKRLDEIVGVLSPGTEAARVKARLAVSNAKRFYDAGTKGRRADGWRAVDAGPKEGLAELTDLRNRSRDFVRNNGYAKKAVGAIVSNTVGHGIALSFRDDKSKLRLKKNTQAYNSWANSTAADFEGQNTFGGLQVLIMRTLVESGEVFIRRRVQDKGYFKRTGKVPVQIQVLEPEFIDHSKDSTKFGLKDGKQIISGVQFDALGRKEGYWVHTTHPSLSQTNTQSVFVPADEMIHLLRVDRPGQIRGIPWSSAIGLNLRDLDLFEDAELVRRKTSAAFCGYISMGDDAEMGTQQLDANGNPILPPLMDRLEPGAIEYLAPGESIQFTTPPNVTGYAEYVTSMLHKIASGFEVPYFVLTGDYSQMNFSSGRMGFLEWQRLLEQYRWTLLIPRCLDVVLKWFMDAAELVGFSFEGVDHEWTPPKREMIDPMKEIQATLLAVKAGLVSMPEAIKEAGYDPEVNVEEMKAWNEALDKAGIILDSDPRKDPKRQLAANTLAAAKIKTDSVATEPKVD